MSSSPPKWLLCMLLACLPAANALANIIQWELRGSFIDGAPLTGRFDFNTSLGTYSNIDMTSGPGTFAFASELLGWHYDESTVVLPGTQFHDVVPLGAGVENHFNLYFYGFNPALPTSTRVTQIETVLFLLNSPGKPSGIYQNRSGNAMVRPIPEPQTVALMLAGLGLVGGVARCRSMARA